MILMPPPSLAVEYKYAGESDVDDATGRRNRCYWSPTTSPFVFLRQEKHLPLLLSYRGPKPRIVTMTRQAGGAAKPEDIKKAREEAEKKMHAEAPASRKKSISTFV